MVFTLQGGTTSGGVSEVVPTEEEIQAYHESVNYFDTVLKTDENAFLALMFDNQQDQRHFCDAFRMLAKTNGRVFRVLPKDESRPLYTRFRIKEGKNGE